MPVSKHNKTKRGTQKQRVKTHDQYLATTYPKTFGHISEISDAPAEEKNETPTETI